MLDNSIQMGIKWRFGKKAWNIVIVYATIFACGLYIIIIDYKSIRYNLVLHQQHIESSTDQVGLFKIKFASQE